MKSTGGRQSHTLSFVYRSLIVCLILLGLVFIGGTIYGIFFHGIPQNNKQTNDKQINVLQRGEQNGQGQTFTGIGQVRSSTADPQPEMVILFVTFIYYPDDKAFSEELALRVRDFREIIASYISSFPAAELQKQGEESIKSELLRRFNAILRLGQIDMLYFSDFMIIG